jgi:hypothetical protein
MQLTITEAQRAILQEVLDTTYRELRYEIADTDNSSYKAALRQREEEIRAVLDLVGGPLPDRRPTVPATGVGPMARSRFFRRSRPS